MRFTPFLPAALCVALATSTPAFAQTSAVPEPKTEPAGVRKPVPARKAAKDATTRRAKAAAAPSIVDPETANVAAAREQLQRERSEVEALRGTTVNLIRMMVQEGLLPRDKAKLLLGEADGAALPEPAPKPTAAPVANVAAADGSSTATADGVPAVDAPATPSGGRRKKAQTVRVPYISETVKNEIRDQLRQEVFAQAKSERWAEPGTLPEWLDRIVWEGDLRLRYQGENFQPGNIDILTNRQVNTDPSCDSLRP